MFAVYVIPILGLSQDKLNLTINAGYHFNVKSKELHGLMTNIGIEALTPIGHNKNISVQAGYMHFNNKENESDKIFDENGFRMAMQYYSGSKFIWAFGPYIYIYDNLNGPDMKSGSMLKLAIRKSKSVIGMEFLGEFKKNPTLSTSLFFSYQIFQK